MDGFPGVVGEGRGGRRKKLGKREGKGRGVSVVLCSLGAKCKRVLPPQRKGEKVVSA